MWRNRVLNKLVAYVRWKMWWGAGFGQSWPLRNLSGEFLGKIFRAPKLVWPALFRSRIDFSIWRVSLEPIKRRAIWGRSMGVPTNQKPWNQQCCHLDSFRFCRTKFHGGWWHLCLQVAIHLSSPCHLLAAKAIARFFLLFLDWLRASVFRYYFPDVPW